jgi:outer membrane receptor protein involved in Fe transport
MRKAGLLGAVLVLLGAPSALRAQTATGQITGTVTDVSGAVVPGATITVVSELTGSKREATTGKAGDYVIPLLPVSTYSVTASLQGFRPAKRTGVRLNVDQVARVDLDLQTGELTEAVEVQAAAVALDSETATVGQVITEKQITDLPLNGRNFLSLLFLGAGAVETDGEQGTMRQGVGQAISLMGGRPTSNNFMIDGTSNTDTSLGTPAVILSVDALEEFKEQTKTYSAEYGFSANQVNLVSKSGSNQFHGALFYFGRDDSLDARNFFDPPGQEKPKLDQKQFGGTISGPIIKNKTFLLFNYEGARIDRGTTAFYTVPTPDQLAGRFDTTIIDPVTGQPFPNNTVPTNRFSRLAQLAIRNEWWPAPNVDLPQGNYQQVRTLPQKQNQWTARLDQELGRFGRVFVRYTKTSYENTSNGTITPDVGDSLFIQDNTNWQVSHTWPINNSLVNVLRVGRVEATANQEGLPCSQSDIDFLALTGVFTNIPDPQRGCPGVGIQGFADAGGDVNDYTASNQPMWDVSNTATWITGDHTLKFGVNYRRWWLQRDLANDFLGNWGGFNVGFTGSNVADFLLGYYGSNGVSVFQPGPFPVEGQVGNPREFNFTYIAPYVQDDWKVNHKLTLSLGLRYDYRNVPYETNNRMGWRNLAYAPGGLSVADESLVPGGIVDGAYYQEAGRRSPENPDSWKVFAPRIGITYRPTQSGNTVFRAGYGIFFDSAEGREIDGSADIYPYVSRGTYSQTLGQTAPLQTTDQLFPSFTSGGVATPAANTFLAVSQSPEPRNPRVQQWSAGVQHQLSRTTSAELNYVGAHGSNLLMRRNIAQALPYTAAQPTVAERKPFPNFGVYIDSDWSGWSDYHALNATVTHHGRGFLASMAFTWAKSTDSKSAAAGIGASNFNGWQGFLNNHDPERDHGLSDFDVEHRLVASFVWNLPFGKGERFGGDASGVKQAIIGGWQLNGIYLWQGGFPLTVQAADLGGVLDTFGTNRADLVGDPGSGGGSTDRWFNTSAFAQPALGSFGTTGRNTLRGPGQNNLDLGLFKNFFLPRNATLQLRVEAFNAFNHPQWLTVETNLVNSNFGVVTAARPGRIVQLGAKLIW